MLRPGHATRRVERARTVLSYAYFSDEDAVPWVSRVAPIGDGVYRTAPIDSTNPEPPRVMEYLRERFEMLATRSSEMTPAEVALLPKIREAHNRLQEDPCGPSIAETAALLAR